MSTTTANPTTFDTPVAESEFTDVRRMRMSLLMLFGLFGIFATAWGGRAPSVREALGVSVGQFGTIIVVGAIGSLLSVTLSGIITPRLGSRRSLNIAMVGAFIGLLTCGLSLFIGSVPLFVAGILVNGLSNPFTNVTQNLEAARVEKMLGKPVLPAMHAAFPIGAALGSGIAAISARVGLAASWHLILIAVIGTAVRFLLIPAATKLGAQPVHDPIRLPFARKSASTSDAHARSSFSKKKSAWTEPRTLMLGVLLMAATMSEGSAGNWLNLSVVEGFGSAEAVGALAYATFVLSMLSVRLVGAGLLTRFGRVKVLTASALTALAGLLLFTAAPLLPLAWAGIVFWGAGAAMAWPTVMGAAADQPERAAARVAVASSFSSVSMLVAPPLLGMLGDSWGLRNALMLIAIPMVAALFVAKAARPLGSQQLAGAKIADQVRSPGVPIDSFANRWGGNGEFVKRPLHRRAFHRAA